MTQAVIPGLEGEPVNPVVDPDPDDFDWLRDEAVIVEQQRSVAVYRNPRDHVVIRAEGDTYHDEDKCIVLATPDAVKAVIVALQRALKDGWR